VQETKFLEQESGFIMSRKNTRPFVFTQDNEDDTYEVVAGDFEAFNVTVVSNGDTSTVPAQMDRYGFYMYGDTLPKTADVQVSR
jgi:hypothetical protein